MITGRFFGYHGRYAAEDTITPGSAHWVKVNQNGTLTLGGGTFMAGKTIHIVPTGELPPAPPPGGTGEQQALDIPEAFAISQNYPNPFNPATVIQYQLPVASHVTLTLYNVLGEEIKTLVDEVQGAGFKSIAWDASA